MDWRLRVGKPVPGRPGRMPSVELRQSAVPVSMQHAESPRAKRRVCVRCDNEEPLSSYSPLSRGQVYLLVTGHPRSGMPGSLEPRAPVPMYCSPRYVIPTTHVRNSNRVLSGFPDLHVCMQPPSLSVTHFEHQRERADGWRAAALSERGPYSGRGCLHDHSSIVTISFHMCSRTACC